MANTWVHKSILVKYDRKKENWYSADGQKIYGFDEIGNYYGSYGWELVSAVPCPSGSQFSISTDEIYLFFKKMN